MIGLAAQLVPTGIALGLAVWLAGLTASFHPATIPPRVWNALAFLIIASTLIAYAFFLTALGAFALAYPAIDLDLDFSDRQVDLIGEGFDAAIRSRLPATPA